MLAYQGLGLSAGTFGTVMSVAAVGSVAVRQEHMPITDQAVIVGAYRTVTWGVIPVSVFVGGTVVSLLARSFDIHTAVTITMVCATVIGISSYLPLRSMQSLLERSRTEELVS